MTPRTKAILTITCAEMQNPMLQRSRFDETIVCNSWILQENKPPVHHKDGTVSTTTVWGRTFRNNASESKIRRQVENLLSRATTYADIPMVDMDLKTNQITRPEDDFQGTPVLLQDD